MLLSQVFLYSPSQVKFVKRCKVISERIAEEALTIEGEFLTISDMQERKFSKCPALHL